MLKFCYKTFIPSLSNKIKRTDNVNDLDLCDTRYDYA